MRRERDLVFVDLRGTGHSNALDFPPLGPPESPATWLRDLFDPEIVARARAELAQRADLTQYTTTNTAHDLDAVRAALGYERINLYALS